MISEISSFFFHLLMQYQSDNTYKHRFLIAFPSKHKFNILMMTKLVHFILIMTNYM